MRIYKTCQDTLISRKIKFNGKKGSVTSYEKKDCEFFPRIDDGLLGFFDAGECIDRGLCTKSSECKKRGE